MDQVGKTFNILQGDNSGQYGYKGQLFDYLTLFLFFLGIIGSLKLKLHLKILFYTWLIVSLLGEILTTAPGPIFVPRFVVGIPIFYIFVGMGFNLLIKLMNYFKIERKLQYAIVMLGISYIVLFNLSVYFSAYPKQMAGDSNAYAATKIGEYLKKFDNNYQIIFLTSPNLHADFSTIKLLAPKSNTIDIDNPDAYIPTAVTKTIFIIYPNYYSKIEQIANVNPHGQLFEEINGNGDIQYYTYKID